MKKLLYLLLLISGSVFSQLPCLVPAASGIADADKFMFCNGSNSRSSTFTLFKAELKADLDQILDTVKVPYIYAGRSTGYVYFDGTRWITQTPAGSGTVNSGTQYRLGYYATTGTAISEAPAITGNRALVSDANGVPTHSTTTATELGYVSGVTSNIQTQLDRNLQTVNIANINTTSANSGSFAVTGSASFTFGTGLVISGGAGNYSNYASIPNWTHAEDNEFTIGPFSGTIDGTGIAIGIQSKYGTEYSIARFDMSAGANRGKLYITLNKTTEPYVGSTALTFANTTDKLLFKIKESKYNITATVYNITQNTQVTTQFNVFTTGLTVAGGVNINRIGKPSIYAHGGTQTFGADGYVNYTLFTPKNIKVAFLANSIGYGYAANSPDNRWVNLNNQAKFSSAVFARASSTTGDGILVLPEILACKPEYVVIQLGVNDMVQAIGSATAITNIQTIHSTLLAAGVKPIWCTVFPTNNGTWNTGITAINAAINALVGASKIVDQYTSVLSGGILNANLGVDGVHLNAVGNQVAAANFITSTQDILVYEGSRQSFTLNGSSLASQTKTTLQHYTYPSTTVDQLAIGMNSQFLPNTATIGRFNTSYGAPRLTMNAGSTNLTSKWYSSIINIAGTEIIGLEGGLTSAGTTPITSVHDRLDFTNTAGNTLSRSQLQHFNVSAGQEQFNYGANQFYDGASIVRYNNSFSAVRNVKNVATSNVNTSFSTSFLNVAGTSILSSNSALNSGGTDVLNVQNGMTYFGGQSWATSPTAIVHISPSTTAAAQMRFLDGVAPTTPNTGDVYNDGTNINFYNRGITATGAAVNSQRSISVINTSSGALGTASFQAQNGTGIGVMGKTGTGNTGSGIIKANDTYLQNTTSGDISIDNRAASGKIGFAAGASLVEHMTIAASGNVGVGTGSPLSRLHVAGGVRIDSLRGTGNRQVRVRSNGYLYDTLIGSSASGVTTMAAIGASPNANGATISGSTLTLQPASASFGGVVTTGAQSIAGVKTLLDNLITTTGKYVGTGSDNNINFLSSGSARVSALYSESASGFGQYQVYADGGTEVSCRFGSGTTPGTFTKHIHIGTAQATINANGGLVVADADYTTDFNASTYGYVTKNIGAAVYYQKTDIAKGKATLTYNGSTTVFNIAHGLGADPSSISLLARDLNTHGNGSPIVTTNSTNIVITYSVAPVAGSNTIDWQAYK